MGIKHQRAPNWAMFVKKSDMDIRTWCGFKQPLLRWCFPFEMALSVFGSSCQVLIGSPTS